MKKYVIRNVEYIVNRKSINKNDTDVINKIISYLMSKKAIESSKQEDKNDK